MTKTDGFSLVCRAADRNGWTIDSPIGWTNARFFRREDQTIGVHRTVSGRVTYASRNFGESKVVAAGSGRAVRVIEWMAEPAPVAADETPEEAPLPHTSARGRMYERARLQGDWTVSGGSLEVDYRRGTGSPADIHHVHARFEADGSLKWARRDFGPTGRPRQCHGPETVTTVLSWFLEGSQTATKPVIRPALPNTPDRKIRRALEDLEDTAGALRRVWERTDEFTAEDLGVIGQSLKSLREAVTDAEVEAHSLRRQRRHEERATAVAGLR